MGVQYTHNVGIPNMRVYPHMGVYPRHRRIPQYMRMHPYIYIRVTPILGYPIIWGCVPTQWGTPVHGESPVGFCTTQLGFPTEECAYIYKIKCLIVDDIEAQVWVLFVCSAHSHDGSRVSSKRPMGNPHWEYALPSWDSPLRSAHTYTT
jgi:hypothetical protein